MSPKNNRLEIPIVFIVFNRLDTVQRVFEKIRLENKLESKQKVKSLKI